MEGDELCVFYFLFGGYHVRYLNGIMKRAYLMVHEKMKNEKADAGGNWQNGWERKVDLDLGKMKIMLKKSTFFFF